MYEILGLKHVFFTFQETVWSHLKIFNREGENILFISRFELGEIFKLMKKKNYNISSDIIYKIDCLINFVKKTNY